MPFPLEPLPTTEGIGGDTITVHDLPKPGSFARWTPGRKALFVRAVHDGLLTRQDFLAQYGLTGAEFAEMEQCYEQFGQEALRVTHFVHYPLPFSPQPPESAAIPIPQSGGQAEDSPVDGNPTTIVKPTLYVGAIAIDTERGDVTVHDDEVHFPDKEYQLLLYLFNNKDKIVSKSSIYVHLYSLPNTDGKIIDVFMCKIRKKIARFDQRSYIETVWGRGYRLSEPRA